MSEIILGSIADLGRPIKEAAFTTDLATATKMNCAVMDVYLPKQGEAEQDFRSVLVCVYIQTIISKNRPKALLLWAVLSSMGASP